VADVEEAGAGLVVGIGGGRFARRALARLLLLRPAERVIGEGRALAERVGLQEQLAGVVVLVSPVVIGRQAEVGIRRGQPAVERIVGIVPVIAGVVRGAGEPARR